MQINRKAAKVAKWRTVEASDILTRAAKTGFIGVRPGNPLNLIGHGQNARTTGGAGIAQVFGSSQLGYLRFAPVLPAAILQLSGSPSGSGCLSLFSHLT